MAEKTNQTNNSSSNVVEKLARICWNTNGWVKPSGEAGKSEDPKTFECEFRFGFEEWLHDYHIDKVDGSKSLGASDDVIDYDTEEVESPIVDYETIKDGFNIGIQGGTMKAYLNGYQYGFLQQFNSIATINEYKNQELTIHLFTLSPYTWLKGTKINIYVGRIKNVKVLGRDEQFKVFYHFLSTGRLTQMYNDVYDVNAEWPRNGLLFTPPEEVFNIKFKPKDFIIHEGPNVYIPNFIKNYRYTLFNFAKPTFAINPITKKPFKIKVI